MNQTCVWIVADLHQPELRVGAAAAHPDAAALPDIRDAHSAGGRQQRRRGAARPAGRGAEAAGAGPAQQPAVLREQQRLQPAAPEQEQRTQDGQPAQPTLTEPA